jgi:DNA-binding protein WhiA
MSFALDIKREIVMRDELSSEEKAALLSGFIKYNGELTFANQRIGLKLTSIDNKIIRTLYKYLKEFYTGNIEISIIESRILKKNKVYTLFLTDDVRKLLRHLEVFDWEKNNKMVELNTDILNDSKLFWNYIGGVFVACGSANDPETSNYHLELQLKDDESCDYFVAILQRHKFNFKVTKKRNKSICYIKKSNEVSDFIVRVNATSCALRFEATRTEREMKNQVNRYLNIEIHNSQISIKAAEKQIEMIKEIKAKGLFSELSPKAQVLADLRLENPSSSFSELVELMEDNGISITKPGINNLFRNIRKIYELMKGF